MNFRAIGGKWHDFTTRWCRKALKEGFVHFVGTDMHNMRTENRSRIRSSVDGEASGAGLCEKTVF